MLQTNWLAVRKGIKTLIDKITNTDSRTALIVGKFEIIYEATRIVHECESRQNIAQIHHFQGSNNYNRNNNRDYHHKDTLINYQICTNFNQSITTQTTPNNYSYRKNNNFSFYKRHHQLNNCSSQSQVNQGYNNREYNYNNSGQNRSNNVQCFYIRTEQNRNFEQFNNNNQLNKNHIYHQNDEDYKNTPPLSLWTA